MIYLLAVVGPLALPLGVIGALFAAGLVACVVGLVVVGRKGQGR